MSGQNAYHYITFHSENTNKTEVSVNILLHVITTFMYIVMTHAVRVCELHQTQNKLPELGKKNTEM